MERKKIVYPYIPNSNPDVKEMMDFVGAENVGSVRRNSGGAQL